jgi:hypothetical protein
VALASALLAYGSSSDAGAEALAAGLGDALVSLLVSSREGPLLEVSPAGVTQLLEGLLQLVAPDCEGPSLLLGASNSSSGRGRRGGGSSSGIVPALLMLLGERHLGALAAWREAGGGSGPAARGRVAALVALVCEVLSAPLLAGRGGGGTQGEVAEMGFLEQLLSCGVCDSLQQQRPSCDGCSCT